MEMLYRTYQEYARVVEEVAATEDGVFKKDRTPETYGGAVLKLQIVHEIQMVDAGGRMEFLKFENPEPKNKDETSTPGQIVKDGQVQFAGSGGDPRTWTTIVNSKLSNRLKALAAETVALREEDGTAGSEV